MLGDENSTSKIYKDIRQSRICSARLEASSGPRTKGVPTNNPRGRGSGPCLLWGTLGKSRHIVPGDLLVRVQCLRRDLYKAVEEQHKTYRPLDDQLVILSTSTILEPERWNSLHIWPSLVCRLDLRTRPGERFLPYHILETTFHQI